MSGEHRLVSAHRCICAWVGDSAITHIIDVLQIEEVDGRILPTGSIIGGLASYAGFEGARKLYTSRYLDASDGDPNTEQVTP